MSEGNPYTPFDPSTLTHAERQQFNRAVEIVLQRIAGGASPHSQSSIWQHYQYDAKPIVNDENQLRARLVAELPHLDTPCPVGQEALDKRAQLDRIHHVPQDYNNPRNKQRKAGPREPWRPESKVSMATHSFDNRNARAIKDHLRDDDPHVIVTIRHDQIQRLKERDIVKCFVRGNWGEFRVREIKKHAYDLLRIVILIPPA